MAEYGYSGNKICVRCARWYWCRRDNVSPVCTLKYRSPQSGDVPDAYLTCLEARSAEWACGANGRHWKMKEE